MKLLARAAMSVPFLTVALFAQLASNTSLVGTITDTSGAAVSGVNVTALNEGTQETYNTTTNASGYYELQFVKAGSYAITSRKDGFSTVITRNIPISANQIVRTDFSLSVGEVTQSMEVVADVPPIKTDDAAVNELISTKSTAELPLNGRNPLQLAAITPGVIPGRKSGASTPGGGEGYIGAGVREIQNSVSLDGVSMMNNLIMTTTYRPSVDAVQEVQIQTGTYPAQYGGYLGVQVNVVTKSGSNDFHGALFEFLRNEKLDAKDFFLPQGRNKSPFRQNQYGVQFNGPLWIPKIYNGKNRTFFMFGWEGFRNNSPVVSSLNNVLSDPMRTGDFSAVATPIRDPLTGNVFAGNIIPQNRLSPQALNSLQYMPRAIRPGIAQNFDTFAENKKDADQFIGRLDHSISENHRLFFRYALSDIALLNGNANPYNGYTQPVADRNLVAGYTAVLSPTAINDFRFGRQYTSIDSVNFFSAGSRYSPDAGTQLGIPGFTTSADNPGLPSIGITNFMSIGGDNMGSSNWYQTDETWQISNTLSWTKGSHQIAAGFDSRKVITNRTANNNPRGGFSFSGAMTGNAAADFLLGIPQNITTPGQLYPGGAQQWRYGFFIQDKWQASRNLTLTFGLRYELPVVPQSTTGNGTILNPEQTAFIPSDVPSKIPYHQADRNNWAPRFGFAYRLPSRFVIRGGFGIYYNPNQMNTYTLASTNPPFATISTFTNTITNNVIQSPYVSFANPFPAVTPGAPTRVNAFHINPYLPNATMNQWSLSLERGLWRTAGIAFEYLGSHQYHLDRSFYNNTPAPYPGGPLSVDDRRPNQLFRSIRMIQNDLIANYNAGSIIFRQQGFSGLTILASYTFSKTLDVSTDSNGGSNVMDPYNWRLDYGRANWDIPHRFVASYTYEIPFLKNASNGFVRHVLGGWQTNGVSTIQSGLPFAANISADRANTGQGQQRANIVGPVTVDCGSGKLTGCVSINAFDFPALGTFGNSARNFMRGPGFVNFDMSFFKNFNFGERWKVQFRGEFFNIFNHPNFGNPNSTFVPGSTVFGNITTLSSNMRQTQFGLKVLF